MSVDILDLLLDYHGSVRGISMSEMSVIEIFLKDPSSEIAKDMLDMFLDRSKEDGRVSEEDYARIKAKCAQLVEATSKPTHAEVTAGIARMLNKVR